MIKIHLSRILGEKRISQAELARQTGIRPSTVSDIYNEMTERLNIEYLDRICEYLNCNITDLIEYIPNEYKKTGKFLIREEHGNRKNNL
ncbi:MAG: helix-turn-helix transcriptional regulator [Ruminococcus flavefaciens]|nr:helix-turn-helix transcriptional regulator [Ruminococcus flavefaciens]